MTPPSPAAAEFSDLEIRIFGRQEEGYGVEISVGGEQHFEKGFLAPSVLDWQLGQAPDATCKWLSEELFRDSRLSEAWAEARGQSKGRRVRLRIDPEAPELHPLPWELLGERAGGGTFRPLAMDADTPFSRYLAGRWKHGRPIITRPFRVLAAVASPDGLEEYGLEPIEVETECRHFQESLARAVPGSIELETLEGRVSLEALGSRLQEGFHCLHLMAHGAYNSRLGQAVLMLEGPDGRVELTYDHQVAAMLDRLETCPSLVFLASCQSAAGSPVEAWRGLAPALVKAGVPAIVAMRDVVEIDTARHFAGTFYRQLLGHGLVDLAVNEARASLEQADLPGAEVPALFMHLREGRLLLNRGAFVDVPSDEGFWEALLGTVEEGGCTFFLGPEVNEGLLPSQAEMAAALARDFPFPLGSDSSLPTVSQFASLYGRLQVRQRLMRRMARGFLHRTGVDTRTLDSKLAWPEAVELCSAESCLPERGIHAQLADLQLPLYLTTNYDDLMTLALRQHCRDVRRLKLDWRPRHGGGTEELADFDPPASREEPVVMHLFGHFGSNRDLDSMVLTEDDHLDFLARLSRDHEHILPPSLAASLAENVLIFLGFGLRDPAFRILLRGLLNHLDLRRWGHRHVAVLTSHAELDGTSRDTVIDLVKKHLNGHSIDLFWGRSQQFVAELHERWRRRGHG